MKQYVGIAKKVPDSRTPRRFSAIKISAATGGDTGLVPVDESGSTDLAFCTPEEIDTATVST